MSFRPKVHHDVSKTSKVWDEIHAWTSFHEELITSRTILDRPHVELSVYWNILDRVDERFKGGIQIFQHAGLPDDVGHLWKILIKPFINRLLLFLSGFRMTYDEQPFAQFFERTNYLQRSNYQFFGLNNIFLSTFFVESFSSMENWDELLNAVEGWLANDPSSPGTNELFWRRGSRIFERYDESQKTAKKDALCRCMLCIARLLMHTSMRPKEAGLMLGKWMRDASINSRMQLVTRDMFQQELGSIVAAMLPEPDKRSDQACELMKNFYVKQFMATIPGDTESEKISRLKHLPYDIMPMITQHLEPPPVRSSFEKLGLEKLWDILETENPQKQTEKQTTWGPSLAIFSRGFAGS
jgi:hypothetical protein